MADKMTFEDFLAGLDPFTESFVTPTHKALTEKGYKTEVKPAAQGPVVSYKSAKTKKTIINYVFRKSGMQVRIYGDNAFKYQDFLQTLPETMVTAMDKAGQCKDCNARCSKGYPVTVSGNESLKCRYGAFLFPLTPDTMQSIKTLIETEITEREKK